MDAGYADAKRQTSMPRSESAVRTCTALIIATVALAGPATAHCVVDATDLAALRLSKSGLQTQAQVDALADWKQDLVCQTRQFWRQLRANGDRLTAPPADYSPYYLSPDEKAVASKVVDAWITAHITDQQVQDLKAAAGADKSQ